MLMWMSLYRLPCTHFARLHGLTDCPGDVLDRHIGVDAVLAEQVDRVCAQPAQRGIGDALDLLWVAVQPDGMAVFNAPPELRGDDHLVPQRRERLAVLGRVGG
jgi:hypothetical protein